MAAPSAAGLIVAYGDSIPDGATSTVDTDHSWPSLLAGRLVKAGAANVAVVNQGISGNRILRDNAGVNALARFDRDVLSQEGVKWLMIWGSAVASWFINSCWLMPVFCESWASTSWPSAEPSCPGGTGSFVP